MTLFLFFLLIACVVAGAIFVHRRERSREKTFGGPYYIDWKEPRETEEKPEQKPEREETEREKDGKNEEEKNKEENRMKKEDFVRVKDYISDIEVDLKYAGKENFTENIIYDFSEAYLRRGTVEKLAAVQKQLKDLGYRIKIWDAFRPVAAQFKLWEVYPDDRFVANPTTGFSSHSRGNTVDITLVTLTGQYVEMPTEFDDFSEQAGRAYAGISDEARENALLLERLMEEAGFEAYVNEWWHYSDCEEYPVEEIFQP